MSLSFKVLPRQYSVAVYTDDDPVNYVASCQVFVYGDVGCMYTINGTRFFECFRNRGQTEELFSALGVKSLEGYMTALNSVLLKKVLSKTANVTCTQHGSMSGMPMIWVKVCLKETE